MSLSVCASSTDLDLTTTGQLKKLLNTTSTAQDAFLSTLIRSASKWTENYIGYPLTAQSYSESVAGFSRLQLMLKRTPLRAVDRILDATDSGTASQIFTSEYAVDDEDASVLTRPVGWDWNPVFAGHLFDSATPLQLTPMSGQELKTYLVDYRAGYTYGGMSTSSNNYSTEKGSTSTGRTLPDDIELAVLFRAQAFYVGGDETASESLDGISVNYRSLGTDQNGHLITRAQDLLAPYQRFA